MRLPNPLMIMLAAMIIIADTFVYRVWLAGGQWRPAAEIILKSLLFSQNGLLWIWTCLGTTRASLRITASMIATVAIVFITSLGPPSDSSWFLSAVLFAMAIGIIVLLGTPRLLEWHLVLKDVTTRINDQHRFQFSLRSAMEFVTGCAIVLMLSRMIYSGLRQPSYASGALPWFMMLGLASAIVSATAFSVVFGRGPDLARWGSCFWRLSQRGFWYMERVTSLFKCSTFSSTSGKQTEFPCKLH